MVYQLLGTNKKIRGGEIKFGLYGKNKDNMWSGGGGKGRFLLVYLYITYIILCMHSKQHNFGLSKSEGFLGLC